MPSDTRQYISHASQGSGLERRTRLDERGLEHVREQAQYGVKRLEIALAGVGAAGTVLDTSKELGEDGQVQDQGSGEEGVLQTKSRTDQYHLR